MKITESQNGQIYPEDTFSHGAAQIYCMADLRLYDGPNLKTKRVGPDALSLVSLSRAKLLDICCFGGFTAELLLCSPEKCQDFVLSLFYILMCIYLKIGYR